MSTISEAAPDTRSACAGVVPTRPVPIIQTTQFDSQTRSDRHVPRRCGNGGCDAAVRSHSAKYGGSAKPHLGCDGPDQRLRSKDLDRPFQVIGQNVQAHLRSNLRQCSGQEMCGTHPGLRPEGVLNSLLVHSGCFGRAIKTPLHRLKHCFMLPAPDAPVIGRRTLRLDRTSRARGRPVLVDRHLVFYSAEAPDRPLTCRASIYIAPGVVDEVMSHDHVILSSSARPDQSARSGRPLWATAL